MKIPEKFKIGKLYTLDNAIIIGPMLYDFRDPEKDHVGEVHHEQISIDDVFVLLEYCNFPHTVHEHRFRVLTKNGTTGWLTVSNAWLDYIIPASVHS